VEHEVTIMGPEASQNIHCLTIAKVYNICTAPQNSSIKCSGNISTLCHLTYDIVCGVHFDELHSTSLSYKHCKSYAVVEARNQPQASHIYFKYWSVTFWCILFPIAQAVKHTGAADAVGTMRALLITAAGTNSTTPSIACSAAGAVSSSATAEWI
jgi:hypothetical protein